MSKEHESNQPVRATLLPYGQQWLDEQDIEAVVKVLRGDFVTQGPAIQTFERKVAEYVGAQYAVAFANGTAALHGACFAAEIGRGDEVITTPITFLASSNCVLYQGGTPVFADIDMDTYNVDPAEIESKISERTKAIIAVDFTGQPVEIDRISMLAHDRNLVLIQDAAHSLGASYAGRKIGSWADMTMFSFHPVKHVTTGEGGIITTDDERYYERLLLFRSHGMTREPEKLTRTDGPWYYEMQELGYNYRMTDMQAALGASQMDKLDDFIAKRREIAATYNEFFSTLPGLVVPKQHPMAESSWHLYVIRWLPEYFAADRREIFEALRAENIGVNVHYIPVYLQPYYKGVGYCSGLCPNAEAYYNTAITLPLFPRMTDKDVADVMTAVKKVYDLFLNQYE
ncbi:UDP-4-amino-4,6-dideoxy-N-acetyl-beta-L-altrosamine transaminase [Paenibacillus macerans]|uniref:UDP-4-keto-6-deoxy-N-acetylglucosamine 4-aminotransferase n=1 Tax=Paenibacillus macerans TaxID=44252 RepID=A0A090ZUF9_PAEMA|nr:UDP-4-amino-4,6-dideoxy-N-acetyl-beta-L-altrosamine transaminase [Paenibacillus macerans]KFN07771.1 UDP-4-keto-6-deoxy-N-acetylglucosamine 4-aminotransferase [Paenibacillus macerans]MCY7560716.1 UDP-4-amino-4,6-dideoxy-N-acetyl-beta-L-altrosamine transaminase [Paenibacillus macerans]MEC0150725.1 UDP-4-amino-4,6-dideoxy-N-acetyl-beta-L-altrosamine transaminase [Paenibacillus macerans]SUD25840.1 glutamine--scyllo-inositol transaminase [Paenibacillus macerans]